jgi:serine/threonine protein kinase/cytochrome c-type biogenesis protein CcmH/NrfG
MIGKTILHYKILKKLDKSGMSMVYKAQDTRLNRPVALKIFPNFSLSKSEEKETLLNEARAASSLNHPNIVTIYDIGEDNGFSFIVMEYIEGKSLRKLLDSGPLPIKESLKISTEICESICVAHNQNVLHLDIKPENIMRTENGDIRILDFGLAKLKHMNMIPKKNTISGTIEYMSPERFQGENGDKQSDIFAIGIIMYEMVTGTHPFDDKHQAAIIYNILNSTPIPSNTINPQIPNKLNNIIEKMLDKNKDKRYENLDDLVYDLSEVNNEMHSYGDKSDINSHISSIAVLPFYDLSKRGKYEYISEGIAEDLINELSKIKKLDVSSRISSFEYKNQQDNIKKIGRKLKVDSILKGTIQKSGSELRIIVQLVSISDGYIMWSEKFDSDFKDIFKIKDKITSNIINSLRIVLTGTEINTIEKSTTANVEAYDYYLRGRSFFHQMRRLGIESAIDMYSNAIRIDPKYALAYSGLADCYSFIHLYWESNDSIAEKALNASIMAIKLDNKLAEAHVAYGLANSIINNYDKSVRAFDNALNLNPHLFEAYYFNARIKFAQGKINNAMFLYEKACQVQPEDYQAPYFLATIYSSNGRKSDAEIIFKKCILNAENQLHINPTNVRALYMGAAALVHVGDKKRGLDWAEQALNMDPNEPATFYNVSCTFTTAGNIQKGLEFLDKAVDAGFARKDWITYDSDLDPLRSHPKFESIINKLN